MLHAKETGEKMIVADLRFTRTAAKADYYIHDPVYGMDKVKEDVMAKLSPDKVEEVTGVPEAQVYKVAEMMAKNRPSTLVWCMGQTQHSIGNAMPSLAIDCSL